jgi:hypothetical protein
MRHVYQPTFLLSATVSGNDKEGKSVMGSRSLHKISQIPDHFVCNYTNVCVSLHSDSILSEDILCSKIVELFGCFSMRQETKLGNFKDTLNRLYIYIS